MIRSAAAAGADLREPGSARDEARRILQEQRFHTSRPPHPLRPLFDAIGRVVERVGHWLWRPFARFAEAFPVGFWVIVSLVAVVGAVLVTRSLAQRRDRRGRPHAAAGRAGAGEAADPAALERAAGAAEAAGDLELALRLRFRAGVLRLQRARSLPASGILTSGELARRLRSREFDLAASVFDEVVYGRRPAQPADVATAREAWQHVLRSVERR